MIQQAPELPSCTTRHCPREPVPPGPRCALCADKHQHGQPLALNTGRTSALDIIDNLKAYDPFEGLG